MKLKVTSCILILVLLSILCCNINLYGDEKSYSLTSSKGKTLSMKDDNMCWDLVNSRKIKPTKKYLRSAKSLYKALTSLKPNEKYSLSLSNSKYRYYEKVIAVMNWEYFKYYEPNAVMIADNDSVTIIYKGKTVKEAIKQNKKIDKLISKIVKEIGLSKKTTEYNAVILIDEYLCNNIEYCYNEKEYNRLIKKYKENEYQALLSGKGICQDYADCFKAIAERVGLKVGVVLSDIEDHAYNIVYVGGKRYYCDSCWNWCISDNKFLFMTNKTNVHDMSDIFIIW